MYSVMMKGSMQNQATLEEKIMKKCHIYQGFLCLRGYVTHTMVCQTFEGMSNLWSFIILMKLCQTYDGM